MTTLPRSLLVSDDAVLEKLHTNKVLIDPVSKIIRTKADLRLPGDRHGQMKGLLRKHDPAILKLCEWTTRSFNARVGFDLLNIHFDEAVPDDDGSLLFDADVVLYPGERRDGTPMENPLFEMIPLMLADGFRLNVVRLFCRAGAQAFSADRIQEEITQHRLRVHKKAKFPAAGGVVLPFDPVHFPVRFDLVDDRLLEQGLAGVGRGVLDEIQPEVIDAKRHLPQHGYRITSTQFSLGHGRRGVLGRQLVDMQSLLPDSKRGHGHSEVWDGGRTAGILNKRHLELASEADESVPMFDENGDSLLGASVNIYSAPTDDSGSVSVIVPKAEYHKAGFTVTHWLKGNGLHPAAERVHATLNNLDKGDEWGVLVGPGGMRAVASEQYPAFQAKELEKQVTLYGRYGGSQAYPKYPVAELGEFLRQVGNHMQRTALFCRELPSAKTVQMLVSQGVRIIFTGNVSGEESKIYLTNNKLQHLKSLTRNGGLQLYLVTPTRIRQLWNDLFVDIRKLEQLKATDVRIGCYGASATNAEVLLEQAGFGDALQTWMKKHPHTALVTGGAKNGAMGYMNKVASSMGILTVGIANQMRHQEVPDEELDAYMTFDADDFEARQALMAKITTHPLVGPGAQGSAYEALLESVLRKMGKTCMSPIPLVDPMGLGAGGSHLYSPLKEIQKSFNRKFPVDATRDVVLSRSPYVEEMLYLVKTYHDAMKVHGDFMENPEKHWKMWGVPDAMLHESTERTLRDGESTGLPFPSFLQKAAVRLGLAA